MLRVSMEVLLRRYLTEAIGTFFLVLTVGMTVLVKASLAPVAIGAILMVMIYAGGHISGGHYNPAVTVAVLIRRRIGLADAAAYVVAQLAGGIVGALAARWIVDPASVVPLSLSGRAAGVAFAAEALFTFALAYVVLNVATSKDHPVNSFYGLAIGFTVLAGAVSAGAISGGSFNPAVSFGGAMIGLFSFPAIAIHLAAQITGGAMAAGVFLAANPHDRGSTEAASPS